MAPADGPIDTHDETPRTPWVDGLTVDKLDWTAHATKQKVVFPAVIVRLNRHENGTYGLEFDLRRNPERETRGFVLEAHEKGLASVVGFAHTSNATRPAFLENMSHLSAEQVNQCLSVISQWYINTKAPLVTPPATPADLAQTANASRAIGTHTDNLDKGFRGNGLAFAFPFISRYPEFRNALLTEMEKMEERNPLDPAKLFQIEIRDQVKYHARHAQEIYDHIEKYPHLNAFMPVYTQLAKECDADHRKKPKTETNWVARLAELEAAAKGKEGGRT